MPPNAQISPRLTIGHEAWMKLQGFLMLAEGEISGFGRVIDRGEGNFFVDDIFILPQKGNSAATVIDDVEIAELLEHLIETGENPGDIKLWWHSHAAGGLFFSQTDHQTMRNLTQNFMFGLVGNHTGGVMARVDLAVPFPITIEDIPVSYYSADEETLNWCQAEIDQKVAPIPTIVRTRRRGKQKQVIIEGDERSTGDLVTTGSNHLIGSLQEPAFRMPEDLASRGEFGGDLEDEELGFKS